MRFRNDWKLTCILVLIIAWSCNSHEDVPVADFDISRITGEYSVNLNIDYPGPRPTASVFNGSLSIDMIDGDNFTMSIDFPGDYFTEELQGSVLEKIVSYSNSAIGGAYFEIQETSLYKGDPALPVSVRTRKGETIHVYALFLEKNSTELEMSLNLIEKKQSPSTLELTAKK